MESPIPQEQPIDSRKDLRPPLVYILVLNWNGCDETLRCLESLGQNQYPNMRTVVIDNGSIDASVPSIREHFPTVEVIENRDNLGYAGGNNVGIHRAFAMGANYVLVLNNDLTIAPDAIGEAVDVATCLGKKAGVVGMAVYQASARDELYCFGADEHQRLLKVRAADTEGCAAFTVHSVSGCAMLVSRALLQMVGAFDPRFFLMYEETDLCARAWHSGFSVVCAYRAKVWHKVSASFGGEESPVAKFYLRRNQLLYVERRLAERGTLNDFETEKQSYVKEAEQMIQGRLYDRQFRVAFAELAGVYCALDKRWSKKSITMWIRVQTIFGLVRLGVIGAIRLCLRVPRKLIRNGSSNQGGGSI